MALIGFRAYHPQITQITQIKKNLRLKLDRSINLICVICGLVSFLNAKRLDLIANNVRQTY